MAGVSWAPRDTHSSVQSRPRSGSFVGQGGSNALGQFDRVLPVKPSFGIVPAEGGGTGTHFTDRAAPGALIFLVPGAAVWARTVGSGAKCCPLSFLTMCLYPLQFPDIVEFCEKMANAGKTVIVAALDGTFQRKAFGSILNLVPLAESVVKLNAVCMECFQEASYTKRLGAEREVSPLGTETVSPCQSCWYRATPCRELGSAVTPQISLPG
ncbi:hypothetical protein Nmel_016438 [Mimus melanotis]